MGRTEEIKRVLIITFLLNAFVSAAKIVLGYSISSVAVLSDGFHSLLDGLSNLAGYVGITLSSSPPDEKHPYGHRKFETLFTLGVGLFVFLTCFEILSESLRALLENRIPEVKGPTFLILVFTLLINIFVNRYELSKGKMLNSEYLIADAGHTASDIFVTIGTMVSLLLSRIGFQRADSIAGLIVGFLVAIVGFRIVRLSVDILVDKAQMDMKEIKKLVMSVKGVTGCHHIRTRGTKESVFLDLHAEVDGNLSLEEAHDIAHRIEDLVKKEMPNIRDVVVHVEPENLKKEQ
jgi:cation diffusion facilitator family transporter